MIKNLFLVFILSISTMLISCSKEEENINNFSGDSEVSREIPLEKVEASSDGVVMRVEKKPQSVRNKLEDKIIFDVITLALGIFAFVSWINYIADFNPLDALPKLILPALATFMCFQWQTLFGWVF